MAVRKKPHRSHPLRHVDDIAAMVAFVAEEHLTSPARTSPSMAA